MLKYQRHLLQIINDILDLSKIEANKLEIEEIEFSPFELLADVQAIVKPLANAKGLTFKTQFEFPIPKTIVSDYLRIKQIIINLVSNAIKFTETGHVIIVMKFENNKRNIIFQVIDSGIGMTESQLASIFEAFTQADSSTTRKYGGTGLGLSLSKELAFQMGGDISAKSLINTGSQFEFTVSAGVNADVDTVRDVSEIPIVKRSDEVEVFTEKYQGSVLLAEDNADNQRKIVTG